MSIFNYTLPSGAEFVVRGPPGATQAEADRIFYEQVAAGQFVGYQSGQTLTSTATQITKFELSRLDRGTAGVDNPTVLSLVQGLPVLSAVQGLPGLSTVQGLLGLEGADSPTLLAILQSLPVIAGIPNLSEVPLTSPINEANIVLIKGDDLDPDAVGPLTPYQVQKLLAQIANLVNQESDQISQTKGIGRYGFTAYALEEAGYVKPGTSLRFFAVDPEDFVTVMNSPSVWTGKDGVYSLADLLGDAPLQNRIQVELMQQGYDQLTQSGVITQPRTPGIQLSTGQVYTTGGLQSISNLVSASVIGGTGRLSAPVNSGILQNIQTSGTVLNRLIRASDINLNTIGSGAVNTLTAGLRNPGNLNVASIGSALTNQINGSVGALVANASKWTSQATAAWARSGGIGTTIGSFVGTTRLDAAPLLPGQLNNIAKNLTNLGSDTLGNLTSNLNVFGKAGSFATNFANPLGNLNNLGNIGNLGSLLPGGGIGGALTGQLGGLSGALTGQLGGLTGQLGGLTGAFGSLGSFANIGAVGDLFGGGGDLVSGTAVAAGYNNTVNRATVDAAVGRVIGSPKVPFPTYQYPGPLAQGPRLDIQQAFSFLRTQPSNGGGTFGQTVTI